MSMTGECGQEKHWYIQGSIQNGVNYPPSSAFLWLTPGPAWHPLSASLFPGCCTVIMESLERFDLLYTVCCCTHCGKFPKAVVHVIIYIYVYFFAWACSLGLYIPQGRKWFCEANSHMQTRRRERGVRGWTLVFLKFMHLIHGVLCFAFTPQTSICHVHIL